MDIVFWTLDFSDKFILPATSKDIGYVSMNAKIEFCGSGSCQLVFSSAELEEFAKAHPEGFFLIWGDFQGYITDWQFTEGENRLFGSHLNSIIHKAVFPPQDIAENSDRINTVIEELIGDHIPWILFVQPEEKLSKVAFVKDSYTSADSFIQEYLEKAGLGYRVYIEDKKLYFEILSPKTNSLMLSKNNLNVYEIQEDFSNKKTAYGGWYKKTEEDDGTKLEEEQWLYISTDKKKGIYTQDTVLTASSPQQAMNELLTCKDEYTITCKTRNIEYKADYELGDIVRLQQGRATMQKQISTVELWLEGSTYHEEPQLTDFKEV